MIVDNNMHGICISPNLGGETIGSKGWSSGNHGANTDYWAIVNDWSRSIYVGYGSGNQKGQNGAWDYWPLGCRVANICLANLDMLTDATQEQKDLIEGQARFFRAFLHFEIACAYGTIPYLEKVFTQDSLFLPRHWTDKASGKQDYQAVTEKMVRDLKKAADLLPEKYADASLGRITKGAAYALMAKALLYAGSPLMNEASGGPAEFDQGYMTRAAEAAAEVIKIAEKGVYSLTPFENYRQMFATIDGIYPGSDETILQRWESRGLGKSRFDVNWARIYCTGPLGGNAVVENPTQKYLDKFEMNDGSQYKKGNAIDGGYDDDLDKFNNQRDPRFDYNFWLHGEKVGNYTAYFHDMGKGYHGNMVGPFLCTKYYYPLVDNKNKQWGKYNYTTPRIRLADVYLMYAEAVFEATGDPNSSIGGVLSAVDAVNRVRLRAGMPAVSANPAAYQQARLTHGELDSDHPFRLLVRNERNVELCFEGHYWWDMRRWKRSHLLENKLIFLKFDKDYTSVSREVSQPYVFESRHYWLPFQTQVTKLYPEFEQNPGW